MASTFEDVISRMDVIDERLSCDLPSSIDGMDGGVYTRADSIRDEVKLLGLGLPAPDERSAVGLNVLIDVDMTRTFFQLRWWIQLGRRSLVAAFLALSLLSCQSQTSPSDAPQGYDQLVQHALAEAEARKDTSFFWLRNTGNAQARSLMLDLGVDYLRYDRNADVLCVWTGEGLWPARGYVTAPEAGRVPVDSVGRLCNIEGTCSAERVTEKWGRFRCE